MNERERLEITFSATDADLWEYLNAQDIPKAAFIKKILRESMEKERLGLEKSIEPPVSNGSTVELFRTLRVEISNLSMEIDRASSLHYEVQEKFFEDASILGEIPKVLTLRQQLSFERYKHFIDLEGDIYCKLINRIRYLESLIPKEEKNSK